MKGYIYDCSHEDHADQFFRTTEAIADYIALTCKSGYDIHTTIMTMTEKVWEEPSDPCDDASYCTMCLWEAEAERYVERKQRYQQNKAIAYSTILAQCSRHMAIMVEGCSNHERVAETRDIIGLLENIRNQALHLVKHRESTLTLVIAKKRFYAMKQGKTMTCLAYMTRFNNQVKVVELCGGDFVEESMVDKELSKLVPQVTRADATAEQLLVARASAKNKFLARAFFLGSDRVRYGKLVIDTHNSFLLGTDTYPNTVYDAFSQMEGQIIY